MQPGMSMTALRTLVLARLLRTLEWRHKETGVLGARTEYSLPVRRCAKPSAEHNMLFRLPGWNPLCCTT